ncbi:MAG: matrixin family metalloprotease [bacterium]|nr:matrixin family metalloprotease [bacterium]
MFKKSFSIFAIFSLVLLANPALAGRPESVVVTNLGGQTLSLPGHAYEVAQNVFSLGTAFDEQSGLQVEGYAIVDYRNPKAKPDNPGGGKGKGGGGGGDPVSSCYTFISKGAKWKTVENWIMNPANSDGMDENVVFNTVAAGVDKWEAAAENTSIIGSGSVTSDLLVMDTSSTDGLNEVYFGDLDAGTIGVTIIWGIFSGPPFGRQLVEWDQVYNTDFTWSLDAEGSLTEMDLDNIVTHELGHTFGLGDLYTQDCVDETMYGYGSEGEIKKRDLNVGDIVGVKELYK